MKRTPQKGEILKMTSDAFTGIVRVLEVYRHGNHAPTIGVLESGTQMRVFEATKDQLTIPSLQDHRDSSKSNSFIRSTCGFDIQPGARSEI